MKRIMGFIFNNVYTNISKILNGTPHEIVKMLLLIRPEN